MYSIKAGEVYEDGTATGVKALTTKTELWAAYGWSRTTGMLKFNAIAHKIYDKRKGGGYNNRVKMFSITKVTHIINHYGLY